MKEINLEDIVRREKQTKALFDELVSYNLYYQYLCNCLFDQPHAQLIKEIVQHHDYSGSVYNEYMPIAMKDLLGGYSHWGMGDASFSKSGLPETVEDYFKFIIKEHIFLDKRNRRIVNYCRERNRVIP